MDISRVDPLRAPDSIALEPDREVSDKASYKVAVTGNACSKSKACWRECSG